MHTFLTKSCINQHADNDVKLIEIDKTVIVTSEARDQAFKRGVILKMVEKADNPHGINEPLPTPQQRKEVQAQVRSAVIARLGFEPEALDSIITNVLNNGKH